MGLITRDLEIWGTAGHHKEIEGVLFDSGASVSVIRADQTRDLCEITPFPNGTNQHITLADGVTKLKVLGGCSFSTKLEDESGEANEPLAILSTAWVIEQKSKSQPKMIIGADALEVFHISLEEEEEAEGGGKIILPSASSRVTQLSSESPLEF